MAQECTKWIGDDVKRVGIRNRYDEGEALTFLCNSTFTDLFSETLIYFPRAARIDISLLGILKFIELLSPPIC